MSQVLGGRGDYRGPVERQVCLLVQVLMLASLVLANKVDSVVAAAQRQELGLCAKCGGLNDTDTCRESDCPLRQGR